MKSKPESAANRMVLGGALLAVLATPLFSQVTIDVSSYANPCGRWDYRWTEKGVTGTWTTEVLGTRIRNRQSVYLRQEYSENGNPNDQSFLSADLSKGLFEAGGLNDNGQPSEETFYWSPMLPLLMKTFTPGLEYADQYTRSGFAKVINGSIKTEAESVTVPAGTFDSYKVTRAFTVTGKVVMQERAWYAKHVGLVKRDQDGSVWELTSYQSAPRIVVEQPAGTGLLDRTSRKSFGTVAIGQSGAAKTFTIKNSGTSALTGIAITPDGANSSDFSVTSPAKTSLAPGAKTTFKVTFTPSATGTRNAAIHISYNEGAANPFDIKLTGLGAN